MGLQRWGKTNNCNFGQIDDQHYYYNYDQSYNPTNKLQKIIDNSDLTRGFITAANGGAYQYDANGNLTADPNKGIAGITYNFLNLPTKVTFNTGNTIEWLYSSTGAKLRKTVKVAGAVQYTQDYISGIEYKNGLLEAIYHGEGRVVSANGALLYEYAMKDHLGNTRLMFGDRNNDGVITPDLNTELSEVTQENQYYPFGLNMDGVWENTPSITDNLYQYNGKEWNNDFGLGLNDYGGRWYDPAVGRWIAIDPVAETQAAFTPYHYVFNNPVKNTDPDGLEPEEGPGPGGPGPSLSGFVSFVAGAANAIISNVTGDFPGVRSDPNRQSDPNNFAAGQRAGDYVSVLAAVVEVGLGAGGAGAGVVAAPETGGTSLALTKAGVALAIHGVVVTGTTALKHILNPTVVNAKQNPENDGKYDKNSSKNEKHGDGGRKLSKAEKQINELKEKAKDAPRKEREKIQDKIRNIKQNAERAAKGEEHSRKNKA